MLDTRAQVIASTGHAALVGLRWRDSGSSAEVELYQVLRLQKGKIVDMEDHAHRRRALQALGEAA